MKDSKSSEEVKHTSSNWNESFILWLIITFSIIPLAWIWMMGTIHLSQALYSPDTSPILSYILNSVMWFYAFAASCMLTYSKWRDRHVRVVHTTTPAREEEEEEEEEELSASA